MNRFSLHTRFRIVHYHTSICETCNKHNKFEFHLCEDCGKGYCTPCYNRDPKQGAHFPFEGIRPLRLPGTVSETPSLGKRTRMEIADSETEEDDVIRPRKGIRALASAPHSRRKRADGSFKRTGKRSKKQSTAEEDHAIESIQHTRLTRAAARESAALTATADILLSFAAGLPTVSPPTSQIRTRHESPDERNLNLLAEAAAAVMSNVSESGVEEGQDAQSRTPLIVPEDVDLVSQTAESQIEESLFIPEDRSLASQMHNTFSTVQEAENDDGGAIPGQSAASIAPQIVINEYAGSKRPIASEVTSHTFPGELVEVSFAHTNAGGLLNALDTGEEADVGEASDQQSSARSYKDLIGMVRLREVKNAAGRAVNTLDAWRQREAST